MVLVQIYQYLWEVPGPWVNGGFMASLCTMSELMGDTWPQYVLWTLTMTTECGKLTIDYNSDNDKGFQKWFQN